MRKGVNGHGSAPTLQQRSLHTSTKGSAPFNQDDVSSRTLLESAPD